MFVSGHGGHAAPRSPDQEAGLNEKGFIDVFQGVFFLAHRGRQGFQTNGTALEAFHQGQQDTPIHLVETERIDIEHGQGFVGHFTGDDFVAADLGKVGADRGYKGQFNGNNGGKATVFSIALFVKGSGGWQVFAAIDENSFSAFSPSMIRIMNSFRIK